MVLCDAHSTRFSRRVMLECSHLRGPADSERAREHAFQQLEIADLVAGDEFPDMECGMAPGFPEI